MKWEVKIRSGMKGSDMKQMVGINDTRAIVLWPKTCRDLWDSSKINMVLEKWSESKRQGFEG